jgi:hypothetical protein
MSKNNIPAFFFGSGTAGTLSLVPLWGGCGFLILTFPPEEGGKGEGAYMMGA